MLSMHFMEYCMKNFKLYSIYTSLLVILALILMIFSILGNKTRIGYLSEFNFINESVSDDNITNYNYNFRIKYYSKVFRNSDIYGVYIDTSKVLQNNNFIKEIKITEKGSPFGTLISHQKLDYNQKIENINYILKLKPIFIILLYLLIVSIVVSYFVKYINKLRNIYVKIVHKNSKVYALILLFYSCLVFVLFISVNVYHKSYLSDFQLIEKTPSGYIYSAKVNSKGFFSPNNLIYKYSDKPIKLENKPNYIRNYGYNLEINRKPDWYDNTKEAAVWNNDDGSFTVSNSIGWNTYNYVIPLSKGEIYKTSIEAKRISGTGGKITYYLDAANNNIYIPNTIMIENEYKVYSGEIYIDKVLTNEYLLLNFYFPNGEINIKSIKIEQISDNLFIKNNNDVFFTTDTEITDSKIDNVSYKLSINKNLINILITIFILLASLLLINILFVYYKQIIAFLSNLRNHKKRIVQIYLVSLIIVSLFCVILAILGNFNHKGYISNFQLVSYSESGYVYKADLYSKSLFFNKFLFYISEKPIILEDKPDYIKNYGYSTTIKYLPEYYDGFANYDGWSKVFYDNANKNIVFSNSTGRNLYLDIVHPTRGEKYYIELKAKGDGNNKYKIYYSLDGGLLYNIMPNSDNISSNKYDILSQTVDIYTSIDKDIYIDFHFPYGSVNVEYIKIEQISDNLYIKGNNNVILTTSEILDNNNILENVFYSSNLNINVYFILLCLIIIFIMIYSLLYKEEVNTFFTNKKFTLITISISLILFIFHFWLCFPGYYQILDNVGIMNQIINGIYSNWHPVIMYVTLDLLYKLFGYHTFYFTFINLICFYTGLVFIILALYYKFKKKRVLFLFVLSFLPDLFFTLIDQTKDFTASYYVWLGFSMVFFEILIPIKNKKINILFNIILIFVLILGLLWRHNMIVTIYPIFLVITFLILKNMNIKNKIKYLASYSFIMVLIAIILIAIHSIFPRIVLSGNLNSSKVAGTATMLYHIMACAAPENDDSLIPLEWYKENKTFEDAKKLYYNNEQMIADLFFFNNSQYQTFKFMPLNNLNKVWIKYILKYPMNYLKHSIIYSKKILDWPAWIFPSRYVQEKASKYFLYKDLEDNYVFTDYGISFSKFQEKIYSFIFNLKTIHSKYFLILSILLFFVSGILFLIKKDILILFSFSTAFSCIATFMIITLFSPAPLSRYFFPIIPISIMSLISFILFICINFLDIKKTLNTLRSR